MQPRNHFGNRGRVQEFYQKRYVFEERSVESFDMEKDQFHTFSDLLLKGTHQSYTA